MKKSRLDVILDVLDDEYPERESLLDYSNPFELMVAVSLSAQTTDAAVNRVTPVLFRRWPDAESLAQAPLSELEEVVHSLGFFRQKAKNLVGASQRILSKFKGEVPSSMNDLTSLPGVGRKSANVIRGHLWGKPGIIVDTHFGRVCRRLGLTTSKDPVKVEKEIGEMVALERQHAFSMTANFHGRRYCHARKPLCEDCPLSPLCPQLGVEGTGSI